MTESEPTTEALTTLDRLELLTHLVGQGWHFEPAVTLSGLPDAATRLAMFRLVKR